MQWEKAGARGVRGIQQVRADSGSNYKGKAKIEERGVSKEGRLLRR